jgi:hypothetical protein
MIDLDAFIDEFEKISSVKSRHGSMPIRVHNLLKKTLVDKSRKISTKLASPTIHPSLRKYGPPVGLFLGGALTMNVLQQAKQDWELGRMIRKQQGMQQ